MVDQSSAKGLHTRLIQYLICPEDKLNNTTPNGGCESASSRPSRSAELHIVLFPADAFPLAKQFWQHTGMGISSRLADHCLSMLPEESVQPASPPPPLNRPSKGRNKHYAAKGSVTAVEGIKLNHLASPPVSPTEDLSKDQSVYLEERYGRNLPVGSAASAKHALRRRIAGVLLRDSVDEGPSGPYAGGQDVEIGPSSRGVTDVTENDVFLFPTGMSAIWNAHHLASKIRPAAKSVCFGYVIRC